MLLDKGAEKDTQSLSGDTALMAAAEKGEAGCLQLLLKAGADIEAKKRLWKYSLNNSCRTWAFRLFKIFAV